MIEHSAEVTKLFEALHQAQSTLRTAKEDSENPHFKSRYASLESIIEAIRPAASQAGLAFIQAPGPVQNGLVAVETMLAHRSGQWIKSTLAVPITRNDPQAFGSAVSYAKRYALIAMFGLATSDDDDGEAASKAAVKLAPKPAPKPTVNVGVWLERIAECSTWPELQELRSGASFKRAWKDMSDADRERIVDHVEHMWPPDMRGDMEA